MTALVLAPDPTAAAAAYLLSIDAIVADVADRVGAKLLDTGTRFPAVRLTEISTADADVDGWARSLMQLDCFHTTLTGAADLARTVSAALVAAANWTDGAVVLGRTETVRRRPEPDDANFNPPQPRWIVTGRLFLRPA